MSNPNIKQVLLNRISVNRIAQAKRGKGPDTLDVANKKFKDLSIEEVVLSFEPVAGADKTYVAKIDVSKSRGFVMTGQRFSTGKIFSIAEPVASIVTTDEDVERIVKPGLYVSNESGRLIAILNEEDDISRIYDFIGFSFDSDEISVDTNKTMATITSKIVEGEIELAMAFEGDSDLGSLEITADKLTANVGEVVVINAVLNDTNNKGIPNEKVEFKFSGATTGFSGSEAVTDKDGKGKITVYPNEAGVVVIDAFFGIYMRAKSLSITSSVLPSYTLSVELDRTTYNVQTDTDAPTMVVKITDQNGAGVPNQTISLDIGGQTAETQVGPDGTLTSSIPFQEAGDHVIKVTYGDQSKTVTVTVINTAVIVSVGAYANDKATSIQSNFVAGSTVYLRATVVDPAAKPVSGATVKFTIPGQTDATAITDANGLAKTTFTPTKASPTVVAITAAKDDSTGQTGIFVGADSTSASLTDANVTRDVASVVIGKSAVINAVVKDKYGNTVSDQGVDIVINEETTSVKTDKTGVATYTFTPTQTGETQVTVNFQGKTVKTFTFDVNGDSSTATLNSTGLTTNGLNKYVNDYITPEVTIVDAKGNPVSGFNVVFTGSDGQTSKATSKDGNGVASGSLQVKAVGDYTVTVAINGKTVGNSVTVKVTEKVVYTYQDPGVQPGTADVKVGETVSPFVIVLDKDNKVVSGITVTFQGYGDDKTAVTDANGKATVDYVFNETGQFFIGTDINGENPSTNSCVVKVSAAS